MKRPTFFFLLTVLIAGASVRARAAESDVTFRSDVSLVRVDAQVLDRDNRAITGLRREDFVLRDEGRRQEIRNFAQENMPLDVLLLLDVSASMRPHIERIAYASREAMRVLGRNDRVGIMVFDRGTRLRLPFRGGREDVEYEFDRLLRQETFSGGTDITRGLYDAARYVEREGRSEARRAIVIVTDDETQRERDDEGVSRALVRANAVLSALIAPDAMGSRYPGGGRGGSWPGGGGGLGGIIFPGGRGGRGRYPGGMGGGGTHSAGTSEIARRSGGDSMPVDDASSLEETLSRLRQRYALYFAVPEGARAGQERSIEVALADTARRRYPDAEVRFRQMYMAPDGSGRGTGGGYPSVTSSPAVVPSGSASPSYGSSGSAGDPDRPVLRRRPGVDEGGSRGAGPLIDMPSSAAPATSQSAPQGGWRSSGSGSSSSGTSATAPADATPRSGGWRRAQPGEQP